MDYKATEPSLLAVPEELARRSSGKNADQPHRSVFMRDRDRILYSKSFRRLSGKTQVYVSGSGDHRRTRLTHTLEVSQIARTISAALGLNSDLTEAIALGHDIGHTPFGHAGERTLHKIMSPPSEKTDSTYCSKVGIINDFYLKEDQKEYWEYYGFKHNLQSVRATIQFESNYGEHGLDLTNFTLWGMYSHSENKYKKRQSDSTHNVANFYDQYYEKMLLPEGGFALSLEAYVVKEADEIAQRHHDLEDGIRSGAISIKEALRLINYLSKMMNNNDETVLDGMKSRVKKEANNEDFIADMSRIVVNTLVSNIIEVSERNMREIIEEYSINEKTVINFFYEKPCSLKTFSTIIGYVSVQGKRSLKSGNSNARMDKMQIKRFKDGITEKIINSYDVQRSDSKGKYVIKKLFQAYYANPQQLPDYVIGPYLLEVGEYLSGESMDQQKVSKGIGHIRKKFVDYSLDHSGDSLANIILMRSICDYIAGMTDMHAIDEYRKLYG